jgi:hypothetical protein
MRIQENATNKASLLSQGTKNYSPLCLQTGMGHQFVSNGGKSSANYAVMHTGGGTAQNHENEIQKGAHMCFLV